MKKNIQDYLIIIFLLLGPILDVFSFYNNPINIIVRTVFLISIIIYLLLTKKEYKYLLPLLVFTLVLFIYQYLYLHIGLVPTISNILKLLYLPVGMLFFKNYIVPTNKNRLLTVIFSSFSYILGE